MQANLRKYTLSGSGQSGEELNAAIKQIVSQAVSSGEVIDIFDAAGLKKPDLMKTKTGRVVSKKSHANGKKNYANIKGWTTAVQKARKALGVKGFQAVKKGSPLYKKAKEIYGQ